MSEYFRVLNRLQADQGVPSVQRSSKPPGFGTHEGREPIVESTAVAQLLRTPSPTPDEPTVTVPAFLEPLIDIVERNRVQDGQRCLVLTSASDGGATEALAVQAADLMHSRGVPVHCARLSDAARPGATTVAGALEAELLLNLRQDDWASDLRAWRGSLPRDGVALVLGPSLLTSSDAARVACICDGLLILVELRRTSRADLKLAVRRARSVGCAILGLVVVGSTGLPEWARRFLRL